MQETEAGFTAPPEEKLSWATKINYGIGAMGKSLSYGIAGKNHYFYQHVLHMHMGFLSVLYFFGRLWDGVNDLLMGTIIDNTHSKHGKFRPWIALGALTNAFVTVGMLWEPGAQLNRTFLAVMVVFFYVLWDITYTMIDVGYYAMIPALSMNRNERDQLSMIPRVFSGVMGIVGAFQNKILQTVGGGEEPPAMAKGIFFYAVVSSAVYLITSLYSAAVVKEPGYDTPKLNQEKFTLKQAANILLHNDQALITVGVMILFNWAANLMNGGADNYFLWVLRDTTSQGFFNILMGAAGAIGIFAFTILNRAVIRRRGKEYAFGRKRTYLSTFLVPCVAYIAMAAADRFAPGALIPFTISAFFAQIGYGSMGVMQGVMLADAVDYGEYNTGTRNEGIIFSTLTMLSKLAKAFGDLTGALTAWITKFGGQYKSVVTPLAIKGIKALLYQLPPILLVLALLLYLSRFRLHPERMDEIQAELRARKAALAEDTVV